MSKIVTEGDSKEAEELDLRELPYSDEDYKYVKEAQKGNIASINHIISKYDVMVKAKSKMYFMIGSDRDDMIQEGMIGLYKAIRDYNDKKTCSFKHFAGICVTRQMITAVKTSTRQKHIPLNSYVSLNKPVFDGDLESERTLFEVISSSVDLDPEKLIISKENSKDIENKITELLTPLEEEVLILYMSGKKYSEIASMLGKNDKSIDNAMQRAKKKLIKSLEESE